MSRGGEINPGEQGSFYFQRPEAFNRLAPSQPDFGPGHVKSPEALLPGMRVELVHVASTVPPKQGVVVGAGLDINREGGFVEQEGSWVFWNPLIEECESSSLADFGLVPYEPSGEWNPSNFVRIAADFPYEV